MKTDFLNHNRLGQKRTWSFKDSLNGDGFVRIDKGEWSEFTKYAVVEALRRV